MIVGKNIHLRTPSIEDKEKILFWENFPDNIYANFHHQSLTLLEIENWIKLKHHDFFLEKEIRYMICENSTHHLVGAIDLFKLNQIKKSCGIGIIIDQIYRQKGLAKESIQLLANHCFLTFGIEEIWCKIHPENIGSIQLFEKCGFIFNKISEDQLLIFLRSSTP